MRMQSLLKYLIEYFNAEVYTGKDKNYMFAKVDRSSYVAVADFLFKKGFKRLLTVSAIDWVLRNVFEIYFIVYNHAMNVYIKVSTEIPRDNPEILSLSSIWENALMHEREVWELFGIKFIGNTMLEPLFLEDWKGPPPFRKDFNWREYVAKEFGLKYAPVPKIVYSKSEKK
ncbi:MAG: NADH-quinone oxidoreductase subunit C [Thermoprotei archaeon]|nr:MAG: NADH-quinone oxidoreductase subunit C [Thermoprotei archaeon]